MKLRVHNGKLQFGSLFKPILVGYVLGFGALMLPMLLLMVAIILLSPDSIANSEEAKSSLLLMPIMIPVILTLQGALISGVTSFGLWLYSSRKEILVVETNDHQK